MSLESQIPHHYGPQVTLFDDSYLLTLLEKLSSPQCKQPLMTELMRQIYITLISKTLHIHAPKVNVETKTRMAAFHPNEAILKHKSFDQKAKFVTVNIARAGTVPSQICYDHLNLVFDPDYVRQDHFFCNRKTNEKNEVVGVDFSGSKIGGSVNDSFVFFPDPMGATGGTINQAVNFYKNEVKGTAKKYIALHLIVTPEYIQKVKEVHPDVIIIAARLDRGLSSTEALEADPGQLLQQEKGLNQHQYIVPGAGGIGELMNNAAE